jgi:hypothetical protein
LNLGLYCFSENDSLGPWISYTAAKWSPLSAVAEQEIQGVRPMNFLRDLVAPNFLVSGNEDSVFSPTRAFRLKLQGDGNLVLSVLDDRSLQSPWDILDGGWNILVGPDGPYVNGPHGSYFGMCCIYDV